jgi:uncharacterized SAM-binding protein YcdF (DUF218 family)
LQLRRLPLLSGLLIVGFILFRLVQFLQAMSIAEPQAYLVLGGAAQREVWAARLKKEHPERPVLISGGSPDPCLYLMFEKQGSPMNQVWTEHCSRDTFDNFYYSLPILEKWGMRKVAVVTDYPQLRRAMPLAHILFASHGMAAVLERSPKDMGDHRGAADTIALAAAGLGWAIVSQFYQPQCRELVDVSRVDMRFWDAAGFDCQPQTGVKSRPRKRSESSSAQ